MTTQLSDTLRSLVNKTRKQLSSAARHEPQSLQPFIKGLDKQLRNYAGSNAEEQAVLNPQIEKSVRKIERARDGR